MPPVSAESSSSSTTISQHIRLHRSRNHQTSLNLQQIASDEPLLPEPRRVCKSAMSSFFLLPTSNETTRKKPNSFPQTGSFRGLGCTASASQQVSVPAVIRSSADWDTSNYKIKKAKKTKNKNMCRYDVGSIKILSETDRSAGGSACAAISDVWCGPGVGFSTDAVVGSSIVPVESDPPRRNIPARRKIDGDKTNSSSINNSNQREGYSVLPRRSLNQESNPYFDSDSTSFTEPTLFSDRYHRNHLQQHYSDGLTETMMLQNSFVMGGALNSRDHFRDLRLNVDNMSYEQLVELGDRIGYVNTGLTKRQIKICLRKVKPFRSDTPLADRNCSICQEEYEAKDEVGKLRCGHRFHIHCVKQWLLRKNSCPVCKTTPYVKS